MIGIRVRRLAIRPLDRCLEMLANNQLFARAERIEGCNSSQLSEMSLAKHYGDDRAWNVYK